MKTKIIHYENGKPIEVNPIISFDNNGNVVYVCPVCKCVMK
jgi:hypothetical protein